MYKPLIAFSTLFFLAACSPDKATTAQDTPAPEQVTASQHDSAMHHSVGATLDALLAAQPEAVQARYLYRHPKETLEFFGIHPGMTVLEALPGGGWYTKLLLPYLGSEGQLVGVDYSLDMYPKFGFFNAEALEKKKTWVTDWTQEASSWRGENGAQVSAFVFGSMPESLNETVDAALFIRALHNLHRFEEDGGFFTAALQEAYRALKPGGILGVVQHEARAEMPDSWADGSRGYLKKEALIERIKQFGFEYIDASAINENPNDQPAESDIVWRLAPNFATSRGNEELKAELSAIGESNRMTLKFRKPE